MKFDLRAKHLSEIEKLSETDDGRGIQPIIIIYPIYLNITKNR